MADRWMDERDRRMRERDWRRSEAFGRGPEGERSSEDRSWDHDPVGHELRGYRAPGGPAEPWAQGPDHGPIRSNDFESGYRGMASGGTGGYDFERGYGDGPGPERDRDYPERHRGESFMRRAGERVAHWLGAERRPDAGHRGKGPKGYARTDARISEDVHDHLTDDIWLDASTIEVTVADGEVTLSGTVDSRQAKHRAERLVEDLSGVKHVQNNLRVSASNPPTPPMVDNPQQ